MREGGRAGPLWRDRDFRLFWAGQTVSLVGSQVSLVALPLAAVLGAGATATEMGVLRALQFLPFLLGSLLIGVIVDRVRRRPLLIGSDLVRAGLLGSIPLAALLGGGSLGLTQLYVVGLLDGIAAVVGTMANNAYLPRLVPRERLIEGNGRLAVSLSVARIGGPGLAGVLVQAFSAPIAIAADALSFLVSAAGTALIRRPEPAATTGGVAPRELGAFWREATEGFGVVFGHPVLRAVVLSVCVSNGADALLGAVSMLYYTRELALEPAVLGLVIGASGPGTLLGALLAPRLADRWGPGPTLIFSASLFIVGIGLIPLAGALPFPALALAVAYVLNGIGNPIFNVTMASMRGALVPDHLLGRVGATGTLLSWGLMPLGALLGGALGDLLGLVPTLWLAEAGYLVLFLGLALSAVRQQRTLPTEPIAVAGAGVSGSAR